MRLSSTLQRAKVELPPPPGPIRMYFCGPTVYARAHIGNARPFILGMWLRAWLRERGYDVKLVHNITDVNDKIYDAAPGASAELAERARRGTSRTPATSASGMPDELPKATEHVPRHRRASSRSWSSAASRTRRPATCTSASSSLPRLRRALGPARHRGRTNVRGRGAERAEGGCARLRALEGEQARRGHLVGLAVGPRPAGLAHRVLGDGREAARPALRDPRRRARPRLPAPRERARAVARARARVRADLDAQRDAPLHRREDVQVVGNVVTIREAIDRWGRETVLLFFMTAHWSKPIDFSEETMAQAAAQVETIRNKLRYPGEPTATTGRSSWPRSTTTSTRRTRSPSSTAGATAT